MTPPPDISVVLCTYNRARLLRRALAGLVDQQTGAAIGQDVPDFRRLQTQAHGHGDGADPGGGEQERHKGIAVADQQPYAVPGTDPLRDQRSRQLADSLELSRL